MPEMTETTEKPVISTHVERIRRQALVFDPVTREPQYDIELTGGELCGWPIYLDGWCLDDFTLARIWAKVRKITLRPFDVDATALFNLDGNDGEFPTRMDLLPNVGLLDDLDQSFTDYTSALAKRLNRFALPRFVTLLVEAQQFYQDGLTTDQIIEQLFPNELDEVLAQVASLPNPQRIRKSRELRGKAEHAYKTAACEFHQISERAAEAEEEVNQLSAMINTIAPEERPNIEIALAAATKRAESLAKDAQEASLDKWNKRVYRDRLRDGLRKNFPILKVEHDEDDDTYTVSFEANNPNAYGNMTVAEMCEQAINNWRPR